MKSSAACPAAMPTPSDYLDLNRQFSLRDSNPNPDELADMSCDSNAWFRLQSFAGWDKVIQNKGVSIILGEPGSGRTWEFLAQAQRLSNTGQTAFFIPLQHLIRNKLGTLLEDSGEIAPFQSWLSGNGTAVFFLDAVDEAKLNSISDFEEALRNFRASLGSHGLERAAVLISCRIQRWDHAADSDRVRTYLRLPPDDAPDPLEEKSPPSENKKGLQVWLLVPLDEHRIAQYAKHKGAADVDGFIAALKRYHCWDFAGRPYDVDFLLGYWKLHKGLGALATMLEELVERQLEEDKEDKASKQPLSREKARLGAEFLAAASLFCRRLDFFSLSNHHPTDESALEIKRCLPGDWTDVEIRALMDRPIFSAPSFGRVRFQHRRTTEFLAACWLRRMMKEGTTADLRHLFFAEHRGRLVLRDSRAAVAAWLAGLSEEPWADELRHLLLQSAPHVFFRHGDPSSLPAGYKEAIVDAFVSRHTEHDAIFTREEAGSLSRMADEPMAESLTRHLDSTSVLPGVKIKLLKMAYYGRVSGCVEAALRLVNSNTNRAELPGYALWVIQECATITQKHELAKIVDAFERLPHSIDGSLCEILFPEIISVGQLEIFLRKAADGRRSDHHLQWSLRKAFLGLQNKQTRAECLAMCVRMLSEKPHLTATSVSARFFWLAESLPTLLRYALNVDVLEFLAAQNVANAIWLLKSRYLRGKLFLPDDDKGSNFNLQELTCRHPKIRRQLFWMGVENAPKNSIPEQNPQWRGYYAFKELELQPAQEDWEWMTADLVERQDSLDRETAFHRCCGLWQSLGRDRTRLKQLKQLVKNNPEWTASLRSLWWQPLTLPWHQYWHDQKNWGWLNKAWRESKQSELGWRFKKNLEGFLLHFKLNCLRNGSDVRTLAALLRPGDGSSFTTSTSEIWDHLKKQYGKGFPWLGKRVVLAVQSGCIKVWESYNPKPERRSHKWELGMMGIKILLKSGRLKFDNLSHDDARKAACYAMQEINRFPEWFAELSRIHSGVVRSVLVEQLNLEWCIEKSVEHYYPEFLSRFSVENADYTKSVVSDVAFLLKSGDPDNFQVLASTLQLLTRHGHLSKAEWAALAAARINQYQKDTLQHELWLLVWIQADALTAIRYLESVLPPPEQAQHLANPVVILCAGLSHDLRPKLRLAEPSYQQPANAERFIRLVYSYVRPSDDLRHDTTYSPVARDDAQSFRGNLLAPLAERPEPEADEALEKLAAAPELTSKRDYIHELMEQRAERVSDPQWSTDAFQAFAKDRECLPVNLDDLFHISLRRIEGIKYDVEDAEESIRDDMKASDNEAGLQSFLVRKLRERNNGRYTAPREPQIDGEDRPDIQIHRAGITGHVQIEAKLGDMESRSIKSLLRDLEHQLLGQYMRDQHSTHGIFVVGFSGKGKRTTWQDPETRQEVRFEEVIARLEVRASELQANAGNRKKLRVFGIDFRERE